MPICQTRNLLLILLLISGAQPKPNTISTTKDDPANIDTNTDYAELKSFEEIKKNRPFTFECDRIVGGINTTIEQHPYIVSLQMQGGTHMCGGTLIQVSWVLTAAHCVTIGSRAFLRDPSEYIIVAGLSDVLKIMDYGQIREIDAFVKHPRFGRPLLLNDIALIKLKNPMVLNPTVKLVELPEYNTGLWVLSTKYSQCTALGWGAQRPRSGKPYQDLSEQEKLEIDQDAIAPILKEVELPLISIGTCKDIINDVYITVRHVCTMYPQGGKDACEGDSGGPLMCGRQQHGVTSWGHGCALPGTPGIFTRVETYNQWMNNVMKYGKNVDPYNLSSGAMCSNLMFVSIILLINELYYFLIYTRVVGV